MGLPRLFSLCSATSRLVRHEPLFFLGLIAIAAIILADHTEVSWLPWVCLVLGGLGISARRSGYPIFPFLFATALVFFVYGGLHHIHIRSAHQFPLKEELEIGTGVEIAGGGWVRTAVGKGDASTEILIEEITVAGQSVTCDQITPVWIQKPDVILRYGARVAFTGFLRPLDPAKAPGGFSPQDYHYRSSGSCAELVIRDGDTLEDLARFGGSRVVAFSQTLRGKFEAALRIGLEPIEEPYAATIAAMTLGIRENTPEDIEELFQKSGTLHLFAVSGMHVGVIAYALLGTLMLCRVPRDKAILVVIPLILFYALLTGLRPSAIRAAVMLSIYFAAYPLREQPRLLNSLGAAALLLLLFDTQQIFLPGFQLSFAVMLAIALFVGPLSRWIVKPLEIDPFVPTRFLSEPQQHREKAVTTVCGAIAVSIAAWVGSIGLLIYHFQTISPVGLLANLFMIPTAGIAISVALASLLSYGLQLLPLTALLNKVTVGGVIFLTGLAQNFSEIPGASWNISFQKTPREESFHLDVMGERGEIAILLQARDAPAASWMIDTGGNHTFRSLLLPTLRSRGVNRLDALFLSHSDAGHIGALAPVQAGFQPGAILGPAGQIDLPRLTELERYDTLRLHPQLRFRVLSPSPDSTFSNKDDNSLVLKIEQDDWTILYTGDIGFSAEKELLVRGLDLRADIWIRGQNRLSPSGSEAFVEAIDPRVVISTDSEFPASEEISGELTAQLRKSEVPLFQLDQTGVVSLSLRDDSLTVTPFLKPQNAVAISRNRGALDTSKEFYKNME